MSVFQKASPNFLTGMSKPLHYGDDFYKDLFGQFCGSLKDSDLLIIIGYGFKDKGINTTIVENVKPTGKVLILGKYHETFKGIKHFADENLPLQIFKGWKDLSSISLNDIDYLLKNH